LINDFFPKAHKTKAFFIYQVFGTLGDVVTKLSIIIISKVGWQMTYVYCGTISVIAGILGLIIIPEPPNSVAIEHMKQELKKTTNHRESIIYLKIKSYGSAFKTIFSGVAPALCLLGLFCR
jgi:sugar phosphate permease